MVSGPVNLEIVFVGRSNVGKSTLFSQLFGTKVRKGRKPGTTIKPNFLQFKDLLLTDLPGFGFLAGINKNFNERVKDFIVDYIEKNHKRMVAAVLIIDGKSFLEIVERWERMNEIPVDVEMFGFLTEFTDVLLVVNKIDKVENENVDTLLDKIVEKLGMKPPWRLWRNKIFPVSAKKGEIGELKNALKNILILRKRYDLLPVLK
jgi:GTP-binding protein EngB required for normal cell division